MNENIADCEINYETVSITCPYCNKQKEYNIVSELKCKDFNIDTSIKCHYCGNLFFVNEELINLPYQVIYFDALKFNQNKQYMQTIISLCTSYEMFFMHVLRLFLTQEILIGLSEYERKIYNKELNSLLETVVKKFAFSKMLNEFIKFFIYKESKQKINYEESKNYITQMNGRKNYKINDIKKISNSKLRNKLIVLSCMDKKDMLINNIRNKVAHKLGYRPTKDETEKEIKIAKNIIFGFASILNLLEIENAYRLNRNYETNYN